MYKWLIKKPEPTKDLDTQPQTGKLFSLYFVIYFLQPCLSCNVLLSSCLNISIINFVFAKLIQN